MNEFKKTSVFMAVIGALLLSVSNADETRQKFSDSMEKSLEAESVSLIQDSGGRVVEVRVNGCELCDRASYLPRRDLEVEVAGEDLRKEEFQEHSGRSGTIVFNLSDYMVSGVYFWGLRQGETDQ